MICTPQVLCYFYTCSRTEVLLRIISEKRYGISCIERYQVSGILNKVYQDIKDNINVEEEVWKDLLFVLGDKGRL